MNFEDEDAVEIPDSLEGAAQVMESWGIKGSLGYDDNGNFILTGKLGEAVVRNDFSAFVEALESGQSEAGLTYQDMSDFNQFTNEWFRIEDTYSGGFPAYMILLRRRDQTPFGFELPSPECNLEPSWEDDERGFVWEFVPMNPVTLQGYEPA